MGLGHLDFRGGCLCGKIAFCQLLIFKGDFCPLLKFPHGGFWEQSGHLQFGVLVSALGTYYANVVPTMHM